MGRICSIRLRLILTAGQFFTPFSEEYGVSSSMLDTIQQVSGDQ